MTGRRGAAEGPRLQGGGAPVELQVDVDEFAAFVKAAKVFDRRLGNTLRKRIRAAAAPALEESRRVVTSPVLSSGSTGGRTGVRQALSRGLGIRILTGKSYGVRIAATARYLPDAHRPMLRLYNTESWRRPVYGREGTWVTQQGRPYFGAVLGKYRPQVEDAIRSAMQETADEALRARAAR